MPEVTVVYARQSTKQQQSIEWQIDWAKELCQTRGWEFGEAYEEKGGHSDDLSLDGRPSLRQMLKDAKAGKFYRMVAWDRTRLARGPQLQMLIDFLAQCGIRIYFGDISDDVGGDNAELLLGFLQAMDRQFLRTLRKNTKRGLEAAKSEGIRIGRVPAGFRLVDGKTLTFEPWARDKYKMEARGMTPSAIRRVERNVRLWDKDNGQSALAEFLATQYLGSKQRYADLKAKRDASAHDFEVWLVANKPTKSERVSL